MEHGRYKGQWPSLFSIEFKKKKEEGIVVKSTDDKHAKPNGPLYASESHVFRAFQGQLIVGS